MRIYNSSANGSSRRSDNKISVYQSHSCFKGADIHFDVVLNGHTAALLEISKSEAEDLIESLMRVVEDLPQSQMYVVELPALQNGKEYNKYLVLNSETNGSNIINYAAAQSIYTVGGSVLKSVFSDEEFEDNELLAKYKTFRKPVKEVFTDAK